MALLAHRKPTGHFNNVFGQAHAEMGLHPWCMLISLIEMPGSVRSRADISSVKLRVIIIDLNISIERMAAASILMVARE